MGAVAALLLTGTWIGGPAALAGAPQGNPTPLATVYSGGDILTMAGDRPTYAEALVERGGWRIVGRKRLLPKGVEVHYARHTGA